MVARLRDSPWKHDSTSRMPLSAVGCRLSDCLLLIAVGERAV